MITNKMQEVFNVLYGYLNDESPYKPLVTKNAPLQPTRFPVVEVKGTELPNNFTTRAEEIINDLNVTINIYAIEQKINGTKESGMQIAENLVKMVDLAMCDMKFTLTTNDEVDNIDKNVYRRLLRYKAGVNTANEKIIRRKR